MTESTWNESLQNRFPQVDLRHDTFLTPARQILTTDMLIEGVHFDLAYFSLADVGWKSIATNVSDIAATGGKPLWVMVSLGVPSDTSSEKLDDLYSGIQQACETFHCQLAGGDTVKAPQWTISVSVIGEISPQAVPGRRHLAQAGDIIAISGFHGLSHGGLLAFQNQLEEFESLKQAHLRPNPRLRLGQQIAQVVPRYAMMDSSDGLADAALRLAKASGVSIRLNADWIELHPELIEFAAQLSADPLDWALYGGEDFELVVSLPPELVGLFPQLKPVGIVLSKHAEMPDAYLRKGPNDIPLTQQKTFQHFPS